MQEISTLRHKLEYEEIVKLSIVIIMQFNLK